MEAERHGSSMANHVCAVKDISEQIYWPRMQKNVNDMARRIKLFIGQGAEQRTVEVDCLKKRIEQCIWSPKMQTIIVLERRKPLTC